MLRIVVLLVSFFAGFGAMACEVARTQWMSGSFPTLEAALVQAAAAFVEVSAHTDTEFGGAIVAAGPGLRVTFGAGCPGRDRLRFSVPAGSIALWHTHGAPGPLTRVFSELDADVVRATRLPLFLIEPDALQVLEPDRVKRRRVRARGSIRWVTGYPGSAYAVPAFR